MSDKMSTGIEWYYKDAGWYLSEMEELLSKEIRQPVQESDFFENTDEIRWGANELSDFEAGDTSQVTNYFLNSPYGKQTRWDLYVAAIEWFKSLGFKTTIDLGAANNHFVFLARKAGLEAYGVEPRRQVLTSCQNAFEQAFGSGKKFGFVGSLKTFADYVLLPQCDLKVNCVSVLNFLHGKGHNTQEIENLFKAFDKCADYVLLTEPLWQELGLPRLLDKYEHIEEVYSPNLGTVDAHHLYRVVRGAP